jgi:hypothetical protein
VLRSRAGARTELKRAEPTHNDQHGGGRKEGRLSALRFFRRPHTATRIPREYPSIIQINRSGGVEIVEIVTL